MCPMEMPINNSYKLNIGEVQVRALPLSLALASTWKPGLAVCEPSPTSNHSSRKRLRKLPARSELGLGSQPSWGFETRLAQVFVWEGLTLGCEHINDLLFVFLSILS